jgi:hypothetical protein
MTMNMTYINYTYTDSKDDTLKAREKYIWALQSDSIGQQINLSNYSFLVILTAT